MGRLYLFYIIMLFVTSSIAIPLCYYCNHINKQCENKQEKLKNDTVYKEKLKREKEITEWVMDDDWQ